MADGALAPTAANRDSCSNSSLTVVMLRLLNAALLEGTKNAYKQEQEQEIFIRPKNNKTEYSTQKPYNILHLCRHKKTKW